MDGSQRGDLRTWRSRPDFGIPFLRSKRCVRCFQTRESGLPRDGIARHLLAADPDSSGSLCPSALRRRFPRERRCKRGRCACNTKGTSADACSLSLGTGIRSLSCVYFTQATFVVSRPGAPSRRRRCRSEAKRGAPTTQIHSEANNNASKKNPKHKQNRHTRPCGPVLSLAPNAPARQNAALASASASFLTSIRILAATPAFNPRRSNPAHPSSRMTSGPTSASASVRYAPM